MFMPFTVTQGMMVHFMTESLNIWLGCHQLTIRQPLFFVSDAKAHHSEWLESISPTERHGRDALNFCNLSGRNCWCSVLLTLLVIDSILRSPMSCHSRCGR